MTLITISTHNGSAAHRAHNIRDERAIKNQDHIDRKGEFEIWRDEKPQDAYERIFGEALKEYNDKQSRTDRKIDNYYNHIEKSKQQHPVYEIITQVGSKDNPVDRNTCKEILHEYYSNWDERNPNLILIGAYFHGDEKGQVHLHSDYVPVAEYAKGLSLRTGLNKALEAQGYEKRGKDTPQIQWQRAENAYLERLCRDRNIEVEHPERDKSPEAKRQHEETRIYQANKDLDKREKDISDKEREQRRNERALDKKEKDIEEKQIKVNKDIEILNKNREVIEQTREAAERIKDIRIVYFEMPTPIEKGFHKGFYTREQVEELTKEINKAREQTRTIEQDREAKSLDERFQEASKRANENVKDKTIDRLREENEHLKTYEKDHNFCIWLDKNYNVKDIEKEYERQEKEHEKELTHTHTRTYDRDR